jgi:mono/diheme cytochrome c family protein
MPHVRLVALLFLVAFAASRPTPAQRPADDFAAVRPLVVKYCVSCHDAKGKKGGLDLDRFHTAADVRKGTKVWEGVVEQLEAGEMPPKEKPQPTDAERKQLVAWVRSFLDAEARSRSGDPGHVPLRRLSNAEYDYTVRDLTGVDLRPAREFPADGAAGEGFTNAAEALSDISPALFTKYLNAAKDIADHAVLLPDGFRFSKSKTRRDWTDEGTAKLRTFYAAHAPPDGKVAVQPYLLALVRHRAALAAGETAAVAAKEKLNPKYLAALWASLGVKPAGEPLGRIHQRLTTATEKDVPAIAADIVALQAALWKTVRVGNYVQENWTGSAGTGYRESLARQVPIDPPASTSVPLRVAIKPAPGQTDITLSLAGKVLAGDGGRVVWQRPRFEAPGKPPLLLKDYPDFGKAFEVDYPSAFANAAAYLAAVVELANDEALTPDGVAKAKGLNAAFLRRWAEVLAIESHAVGVKAAPAVPLELLSEKKPLDPAWPQISGWRKAGTDLPVVVANSSETAVQIPGRVAARGVSVHPMPKEFVAVAWRSPFAESVTVSVRIAHAHPACGNGVAWWLEHRRAGRARSLGEGTIDLGKEAKPPAQGAVAVEKGDVLVLAVDARDANHVCDMTEIEFAVTSKERTWDLGKMVSANVTAGNPHSDVWSFARGPSKGATAAPRFPADTVLWLWRNAAADANRQGHAAKIADVVQKLLSGPRPDAKHPDRAVYDRLVSADSPLFAGVDVAAIAKRRTGTFGLPAARFADADLFTPADAVTSITLPAGLFAGREFVVDAKLDGPADRVVQLRAGDAWSPTLLAPPAGDAYRNLVAGNAAFRRLFPLYACFPQVVPTDEVVTLKMFHREDEPLVRLFLDDAATTRLDKLWTEQRFVSRQPVAEFDYLPQFMGFTTQDTPKAFQQFFIDRKPLFQKLAAEFVTDEEAAIPSQLNALLAFAERAYRRPLRENEKAELRTLYQTVRGKGATHDEAFRGVLARVLVSPAFLFRIETAPKGKEPAAVGDHELATRLSYFLWSSTPDAELTALAAAGKLRDPAVLTQQTARMLKDDRTRALAIEFGTQWIHVRGFDELKEKNEQLFPQFDALRGAMYEESILFFQDLFRSDRTVPSILDADHTFLNEALAKHYGIPGVSGPHFRQVDGVRRYGRGGVLGLGSVQAKQSGASRTSPVLRGNWVVETLLGEKLPRPPANVPQLPEVEGAEKLTMRQLVERHAKDQACAVCHVRIDPFGFALEKYDPIGRLRAKDLGGLAIDASSKLKDGTTFEGIDGLRTYLLTKKKDVVTRLFCKRLLGYALGRAVRLSDTTLLDEMVAELSKNDGRVSAAVRVIVRSPQFRMVRGAGNSEEE